MKTILVVSGDRALASQVEQTLGPIAEIVLFHQIQSSLDHIYHNIPDLILIDLRPNDPLTPVILADLKADPIFGQVPVLALLDDDYPLPAWEHLRVDDYLRRSLLDQDLKSRAALCISRAERNVEVNPLTRLPGNITITKQIQGRLDRGEIFSLGYADIDYFKPFNDKYGFSRGDEILKMLGRLMLNLVKQRQSRKSFVGHIGGDDFIFIMEPALAEETAAEIVDTFDRIVPTFYDPPDREQGFILTRTRRGRERTFPFITLSIGVTDNRIKAFDHYGRMAEAATEMKLFAKAETGSCCRIDRR
jgi:diguanylate cyclase (GGDEF)-like protein